MTCLLNGIKEPASRAMVALVFFPWENIIVFVIHLNISLNDVRVKNIALEEKTSVGTEA